MQHNDDHKQPAVKKWRIIAMWTMTIVVIFVTTTVAFLALNGRFGAEVVWVMTAIVLCAARIAWILRNPTSSENGEN
jgi:hypothetical protein